MSNAVGIDIDTWEEGASQATDLIWEQYLHRPTSFIEGLVLTRIRDGIDAMVDRGQDDDIGDLAWVGSWALLAILDHEHYSSSSISVLGRIAAMAADKHHDYGQGNIERFGLQGVLIRMSDKVERLKNLSARANGPVDPGPAVHESVADSWDDLVGYAIVGIMLLQGTFGLPLERDVVADNSCGDPCCCPEPEEHDVNCEQCYGIEPEEDVVTDGFSEWVGVPYVWASNDASDSVFYEVLGQDQAREFLADIDALHPAEPQCHPIYIKDDGSVWVHNASGYWSEVQWVEGIYSSDSTLGEVLFGE